MSVHFYFAVNSSIFNPFKLLALESPFEAKENTFSSQPLPGNLVSDTWEGETQKVFSKSYLRKFVNASFLYS